MQLGYPALSQYEQAAMFDPTNPNQRQYIQYTQVPGGYGSFYYNQVPVTAELKGNNSLGLWQIRPLAPAVGISGALGAGWDSIPTWGQGAIALGLGLLAGYFGWQKFGDGIKKKIPALRR